MLLSTSRTAVRAVAAAPSAARAFSSTPAPQATLRELESRIKSVGESWHPFEPARGCCGGERGLLATRDGVLAELGSLPVRMAR